ncbi:response regulator [Aromatoleum diolicum]|uniref:Response regulator n=1 Tax=Aromatoleum diolicum TaxID=75796 RepID=A0ABX1QE95_9RHOO|nr:response regulator transcription factor [Aromatoleum diolicum]NMG75385.1 response regulator [Aromatoleum diolicum]
MNDAIPPAARRRILMVDDHPIIREGMAKFLNLQDDLDLCYEAGNAREALATMQAYRPDMAIVDMTLQGDSGLELVKTLRHRYPELPILVMSMHDEGLFAERVLRAGANGYLMKLEVTAHILAAIRQVLAGNIYLSEAMHERIAQRLVGPSKAPSGPIASLTEREFEVLHLIGLGFGTRQIAEKLSRSIKTIEAHRANLKEKLHLPNGPDLVRFAVQWLDSE